MIKKYLVDKIRSANNFLITMDEITSFNKEIIHLCVQFVNCGKLCHSSITIIPHKDDAS